MDRTYQQLDQTYVPGTQSLTAKIHLPDGYELAGYSLRRVNDGHLESYSITDGTAVLVNPDRLPVHFPETQPHGEPLANRAQRPSAKTQKRHHHSRDDYYTDVCGVFSAEIAAPVRRYNHGNGDFCCPRCRSRFTRPLSVKDHFPDCVSKCGNPQALRYTDHPSMAQQEATIQRRGRASREVANVDMEEDDGERREESQSVNLKEMNESLARISMQDVHGGVTAHDGSYIKTEFVFGADIAHQSIEAPSLEDQYPPSALHRHYRHGDHENFDRPTPFHGQTHTSQTPDWRRADSGSVRPVSSTPTPHTNPWNIGIPGSAAEHAIMDMRATAPFEGHLHVSETPERTNGEGLQGDGLDGFMDRRSYFSPTPASFNPSSGGVDFSEQGEMEE